MLPLVRTARVCFMLLFFRRDPLEVEYEPPSPPPESAMMKAILLAFATCGLLGSYITWGFMQEMVSVLTGSLFQIIRALHVWGGAGSK